MMQEIVDFILENKIIKYVVTLVTIFGALYAFIKYLLNVETKIVISDGRGRFDIFKRKMFYLKTWHDIQQERDSIEDTATNADREIMNILRFDYQVTKLVGRSADVSFIREWLEDERSFLVQTITGSGGAGKTRFGWHIVNEILPELTYKHVEWGGGFIDWQNCGVEPEKFNWYWKKNFVLVVDYPAQKTEWLKKFLKSLAEASKNKSYKMRVLLLERWGNNETGWHRELFGDFRADNRYHWFKDTNKEPFELSTINDEADLRAIFAATLRSCESLLDEVDGAEELTDRDLPPEILRQPTMYTPLAMMSAAIVAAVDGVDILKTLNRSQLTYRLIRNEYNRFLKTEKIGFEYGEDYNLVLLGIVTVNMRGRVEEEEIRGLAKECAVRVGLTGGDYTGVSQAVKNYLGVYRSDNNVRYVESLKPDILGEAQVMYLINEALSDISIEQIWELLQYLMETYPQEIAAFIGRCGVDLFELEDNGEYKRFAPVSGIIERVDELPINFIRALSGELPYPSTIFLNLRNKVDKRYLDYLKETDSENIPEIATACMRYAVSSSDLNQHSEALAATEEAVEYRRELVKTNREVYLPYLAGSLHNLGNRLSYLRQHGEALAATEEAVEYRRELVVTNREAYLPYLAGSLHNLGNSLSDLRQHEEALAATEEAVEYWRELVKTNREAYLPDLAVSLNNLGIMFSDLRQHEEALAATEESAGYYRELVKTNREAYLPDLAVSLNNLGNRLRGLRQHEEALAATEEAVKYLRELVKTNREAYLSDLARLLGLLSLIYIQEKKWQQAKQFSAEGITNLTGHFRVIPPKYEELLSVLVMCYKEVCDKGDLELDQELLARATEKAGGEKSEDQ